MSRKKAPSLRFQTSNKPTQLLSVGTKRRLVIERLSHDGRGIAQSKNKTWFITGALPNEEVEATVLAVRSQWVDAKCTAVLNASVERASPPCHYFGVCGGCDLQHLPYQQQVELKQRSVQGLFRKVSGIEIDGWQPPLVGEPLGYRRRTRLSVRYHKKTKQFDIGFRGAFSQQIINVTDCPVLTNTLQALMKELVCCLNKVEAKHCIGHIELVEGSVLAVLVRCISPLPKHDSDLLNTFCQEQGCQLWLQGEQGAFLYGNHQQLVYSVSLKPKLLSLHFQPGHFIQVNEKINQSMLEQAMQWLDLNVNDRVLDLFCGIGNFSLPIAQHVAEVIGVEVVEKMIKFATTNATYNGLTNATFYQSDLSLSLKNAPWIKNGFSVVLLDPPREGALDVVKQMPYFKAQRILYVSCNAATLARDSKLLLEQGYRIKKAGIMDMFPQTSHTEVMVLFEKTV